MRKNSVLLLFFVFLISGCSVVKLENEKYFDNIDRLLSMKVNLNNVYFEGYKFYVPKGITFIDKDNYNALLLDKYQNKYYLFVDVISYYHKVKNDYKENNSSYYSKYLDYNRKNGFIQIDEIEGKYFIQYVYNYVKMEAYVSKESLNDVIINMSSILRSFKFNNKILESLVGDNILDYKEEDYTLFKADSSKEAFLDVVEREETDRYKKDLEDEKIDLDD